MQSLAIGRSFVSKLVPDHFSEDNQEPWILLSEMKMYDMKEEKRIKIMKKIAKEIRTLHLEDKFHGKLSPRAILVCSESLEKKISVKCKTDSVIDEEFIPCDQSDPQKSDIFALGCLFFFVLTGGSHPFGREGHRTELMCRNLYLLEKCRNPLGTNLIEQMIAFDADERPSIHEVLIHPLFWSNEKIATYLKLMAERIESDEELKKKIDQFTHKVLQRSSMDIIRQQKKVDLKSNSQIMAEILPLQDANSVLFWHKLFPNLFPTIYSVEKPKEKNRHLPTTHGYGYLAASDSFGNVALEGVKNQCQIKFGRTGCDFIYILRIAKTSEDSRYLLETWKKLQGLSNENILSDVGSYEDGNFSCWAIPPFDQTLISYDYDRSPDAIIEVISQIGAGLAFLHDKGIVHGTLSPREVVVDVKSGQLKVQIAKLVIGDDDWGLPTTSKCEDLKRLACITYWMLSGGHHPFGESEDRQNRLKKNEYSIVDLEPVTEHLLLTLIDSESNETANETDWPLSSAILFHPFFWEHKKVVSFFQAAWEVQENNLLDDLYPIKWTETSVSTLRDWLQSRKSVPQTNVEAIKLLVSVVSEHEKAKSDLPAELAVDFPDIFIDAWNNLYPKLFLRTWFGLQKHRDIDVLDGFYPGYNFDPLKTLNELNPVSEVNQTITKPTERKLEDVEDFLKQKNKESLTDYLHKKLELIRGNAQHLLEPLDRRERTALHLASHSDKFLYYAEHLISLGGTEVIDIQDADGFTPLHFAVYTNSYLVAKLLIEEKASVNIPDKLYSLTPLLLAMLRDFSWIAKLLLNCETIDVNYRNRDGSTALHMAVTKKNLDIVKYLLQVKGVNVNVKDEFGRTALHFAAGKNAMQIVLELLKHGADVCVREQQGLTPLDVAVITNGNIELIKSLLDANPNVVNKKDALGPSPLHLAINNQSIQTVKLLLERKADPEAFDKFGWRSLHYSAQTGSVQLVNLLLRTGVDIDALDFQSNSALHIAVHEGCVDVVDLLLKCGAHPNQRNVLGHSPLHVALQLNQSKDHLKILQILLRFEADPTIETKNGCNALLSAVQFNASMKAVKYLLANGQVDVQAQNPVLKFTALHLAAAFNRKDIAKFLLDKGANKEARDVNGETPIYYAAFYNSVDVARLLIENSATVNIKSLHGHSPLHVAAARGAVLVGRVLISAGADVNARDELGLTPLHYAKFHRNARFIEVLHEVDRIEKSKQLTPDDFERLHNLAHYLKSVKPVRLKARPKVEFGFDCEACVKVESRVDHRDILYNKISFSA